MNAYIKLCAGYETAYLYADNGENYTLDVNADLLKFISAKRYDNIYVWDAPEIFAIIDAFAINNNLQSYEDLELNKNGYLPRVTFECISRKDNDGGYYERKIWLKTQKLDSIDRHKRIAATSYINIKNFFGSISFKEARKAFEVIENQTPGMQVKNLLYNFAKSIENITGINIFDENGKIKYWTMGGISKAYYFKLFEQKTKGIQYIDYVPQNEDFEIEMRLTHLLSKGILYCRAFNVELNEQRKFDKNSLFPHVSQDCPIFYAPIKVDFSEYWQNRNNINSRNTRYIITFNRLLLKVKSQYPNVLQPHGEKCTDKNPPIVDFTNQSFFEEHFETLLKIYEIVDIDIKNVYRLKIERDTAILEYNQKLFALKKSLNNNSARRSVVKYLLNNLHGKFAQICLQPKFNYTKNDKGILVRQIKALRNTWKKSHFDYLRGAYIYSMAQREMLEELIKLPHPLQVNYIDTDCFVVGLNNAPKNIGEELGEFKVENFYRGVMFYAPKTYIGVDGRGDLKVTCAGMQAKEIKDFIVEECIPYAPTSLEDIIDMEIPTTFTRRTVYGFERVTEWRTIGQGLTNDELENGGYISGTES